MTFMRTALMTLGVLLGVGTISGVAAPAMANTQTGVASWYEMGHTTANGEAYNPDGLTAAHRTLPFGTVVEVKNLLNGSTARLRINDRGPFVGDRIIDVSRGGARKLGLIGTGTAEVRVTTLYSGNTPSLSKPVDPPANWTCKAFKACS